jgi:hypothetical protein
MFVTTTDQSQHPLSRRDKIFVEKPTPTKHKSSRRDELLIWEIIRNRSNKYCVPTGRFVCRYLEATNNYVPTGRSPDRYLDATNITSLRDDSYPTGSRDKLIEVDPKYLKQTSINHNIHCPVETNICDNQSQQPLSRRDKIFVEKPTPTKHKSSRRDELLILEIIRNRSNKYYVPTGRFPGRYLNATNITSLRDDSYPTYSRDKLIEIESKYL